MNPFIVINSACSIIVAAIVTYKLATMSERLTLAERIGLGLMGAGMILNIAPIMRDGTPFSYLGDTPFDDWGSTILRIGIMSYLFGRISRVWTHDRNNERHAAELERDMVDLRRSRK